MTTREKAPNGSPCWVDLWTSDVDGSRRFYAGLFGWEANEPSPEFGGYFMFTREGVPVAGGMGPMGDQGANDAWKVYLSTDDIDKVVETARAEGGQVTFTAEAVADLGHQAVLVDPAGAVVGAWQPGVFPGFTVIGEHGAPSWFELHTRDHAAAVEFYRSVFRTDTNTVGDTDEFRYTTLKDPNGADELGGIMDASAFLPEGVDSHWKVYFGVDDSEAAIARAVELGGTLVDGPYDTPYGRLTTLRDPAGAEFKLRQVG